RSILFVARNCSMAFPSTDTGWESHRPPHDDPSGTSRGASGPGRSRSPNPHDPRLSDRPTQSLGKGHIPTPLGAVKVSATILPVLRVCAGSKIRTSASASAIVRCSTPRGTTQNSPDCKSKRRSRNSIVIWPRQTKNISSSCSCWCQGKTPTNLTSLTSWPFNSATTFGRQCSWIKANFSSSEALAKPFSVIQNRRAGPLQFCRIVSAGVPSRMRDGFRNVDLIHGHEMFEQRLHIRGNAEHGKMLRSKELLVAHVGKEL